MERVYTQVIHLIDLGELYGNSLFMETVYTQVIHLIDSRDPCPTN